MLELRELHRHHCSSGEQQLSEGDIVVVYAEDQPCSCWRLGRIERVIIGTDGQNRAATIGVCKNGGTTNLDRTIEHLYPLEVAPHTDTEPEREDQKVGDVTECEPTSEQTSVHSSRARRSAAAQAVTTSLHRQRPDGMIDPYGRGHSFLTGEPSFSLHLLSLN